MQLDRTPDPSSMLGRNAKIIFTYCFVKSLEWSEIALRICENRLFRQR